MDLTEVQEKDIAEITSNLNKWNWCSYSSEMCI